MIDSIYKIGKNSYPRLLLLQCKYINKDKKINNNIIDDL